MKIMWLKNHIECVEEKYFFKCRQHELIRKAIVGDKTVHMLLIKRLYNSNAMNKYDTPLLHLIISNIYSLSIYLYIY